VSKVAVRWTRLPDFLRFQARSIEENEQILEREEVRQPLNPGPCADYRDRRLENGHGPWKHYRAPRPGSGAAPPCAWEPPFWGGEEQRGSAPEEDSSCSAERTHPCMRCERGRQDDLPCRVKFLGPMAILPIAHLRDRGLVGSTRGEIGGGPILGLCVHEGRVLRIRMSLPHEAPLLVMLPWRGPRKDLWEAPPKRTCIQPPAPPPSG